MIADKKRTIKIAISLTDEEHERLLLAAQDAGQRLAPYIRSAGLAKAAAQKGAS